MRQPINWRYRAVSLHGKKMMTECELLAAAYELEESHVSQFQEKVDVARQSLEDLKASFPIFNKTRSEIFMPYYYPVGDGNLADTVSL